MASWKNVELISGEVGTAKSVVLPTCGCYYDDCYMCSYKKDCPKDTPKNIVSMFTDELETGIDKIKIFTSGSFLDKRELSLEQQLEILREAANSGIKELSIETRPEFINKDIIDLYREQLGKDIALEFALGLESANNDILKYNINKGFTFEVFVKKANILKQRKCLVKTYLLLKPPFLTEYESIIDVIDGANKSAPFSDTISINPVSVHKDTLVERLWLRKKYRPPYLWSLVKCLNEMLDLGPYVMSHPVAVGKERGIHNCGKCEKGIMEIINDYNTDPKIISFDCECKEMWEEELKKIF